MPAFPPWMYLDAFWRCYQTAGTMNAGVILAYLSQDKGKATQTAASIEEWRPLPREKLMRECLLSRGKLDRGLAALKARNLIETKQAWHQPASAYVLHIRLLPGLPVEE